MSTTELIRHWRRLHQPGGLLMDHDRLDLKLSSEEFTAAACGSRNARTGKAEYCGYQCPTLKVRIDAGENPDEPVDDQG